MLELLSIKAFFKTQSKLELYTSYAKVLEHLISCFHWNNIQTLIKNPCFMNIENNLVWLVFLNDQTVSSKILLFNVETKEKWALVLFPSILLHWHYAFSLKINGKYTYLTLRLPMIEVFKNPFVIFMFLNFNGLYIPVEPILYGLKSLTEKTLQIIYT